ncbi:DMT family transporter [Hymenobacter ginsengisoli]|uniref:DMT family transporter n=1 Tax=Hymenobacter ginsengisoli TaxID=1051626 RepID=A0ABP8Q770_9BACT|nr:MULTISPECIES: DMT family transporter [unclassified Hymenobacter]MBO2031797.1 DMT family transporter [Hymenobacter sp. BT559]
MQVSTRPAVPVAGFLITLLGAVLFSTKAILVKLAFGATHTDALTLLMLRMLFSLPFYVGVAVLVSSRKDNVRMTRAQWGLVALLGALGYYVSSLLDFIGLQYVSAGLERLILFLYPSFVVFINALFFKERITGVQKWALLLTYLGIGIAYVGELTIDPSRQGLYLGSFLVFLCAVTYSMYIAGSGKIIPLVGANKFTAYAMLAATAGIFGHFALVGRGEVLAASQSLWGYGLGLAIFSTVLPSFLISQGLKRIGANNVAIISGIGPISTIAQAHFFLHEPIFLAQIGGTVLVVLGVLLLSWKRPAATAAA